MQKNKYNCMKIKYIHPDATENPLVYHQGGEKYCLKAVVSLGKRMQIMSSCPDKIRLIHLMVQILRISPSTFKGS